MRERVRKYKREKEKVVSEEKQIGDRRQEERIIEKKWKNRKKKKVRKQKKSEGGKGKKGQTKTNKKE